MARTLQFTGEMQWPLEDGKQAAKLPLSVALNYTSVLTIEKVFAAGVVDEAITLPMSSAKFMLLQASGESVTVKLNGAATAINLKADGGFVMVWNADGAITSLTLTVTLVPATFKAYLFG